MDFSDPLIPIGMFGMSIRHTASGPSHDRRRRHRDVVGTPPSSQTRPEWYSFLAWIRIAFIFGER